MHRQKKHLRNITIKTEQKIENLTKFPAENPSPVLSISTKGAILYTNNAAKQLLEKLILDNKQSVPKSWMPAIEKSIKSGTSEFEIICSDKVISMILSPITKAGYINLYGRDITEQARIKAEQDKTIKMLSQRDSDLLKINKRLEAMDKQKSEFISIAAHQLRTPLTTIKWIAQALGKKTSKENKETHKQINQMQQTINKMVILVGDILNVTRIEEGRYGLKPKKANIGPILNEILETAKISALPKEIKLKTEIPAEIPDTIIDNSKIKLALNNIIDNAVKYTPVKGTININMTIKEKKMVITISDTGIGIEKKDQSRLFTKFHRGSNALKVQTDGTGLGLFISKNIIESHKGTIAVASEINKGTTFTITLPIK
jgi:signal transduction histidine kinase